MPDPGLVHRVSAGDIEGAVVGQVRELLRHPEIVVGTWLAAREQVPDLTEADVREVLGDSTHCGISFSQQSRPASSGSWSSAWRSVLMVRTSTFGSKDWRPWCGICRPGLRIERKQHDRADDHSPGAPYDPCTIRSEDHRQSGWLPLVRSHPCRSSNGQSFGPRIPMEADVGRGAICIDQRYFRGGED